MSDPFLIQGPATVSFSGGRTSAYMLKRIVDADGGALPENIKVLFANTGKERPETLRFVHECGTRRGVTIHWLEWRNAKPAFEEVGFNSASRNGEPFAALIEKKKRLPNWQERWCTQFLKVQPMSDYLASLGWKPGEYTEVIGLRYDEGLRVLRGMENAEKYGRRVAHPLSKAKVRKADVMEFWARQDFDLGLEPWEGNCDLCFMKGRGIKKRIIRDDPRRADWWADKESRHKGKQERGRFDRRDSIRGLADEVRTTPSFFDEFDAEEYDVECGNSCVPDITLEAAE